MANQLYPSLWARLCANCEPNEKGCWIWTGARSTTSGRYPQINMRVKKAHKTLRAHRVMAELLLGRTLDPVQETIEHVCLDTGCICPNDLALMTQSANSWSVRMREQGHDHSTHPMIPVVPKDDENQDADVPLFGLRYWHPSEPIPF